MVVGEKWGGGIGVVGEKWGGEAFCGRRPLIWHTPPSGCFCLLPLTQFPGCLYCNRGWRGGYDENICIKLNQARNIFLIDYLDTCHDQHELYHDGMVFSLEPIGDIILYVVLIF